MSPTRLLLYLGTIGILFFAAVSWYGIAFMRRSSAPASEFDGLRALADVRQQVEFGPRTPGSASHAQALAWMESELAAVGWTTQRQSTTAMGHPLTNLIAYR